MKKTAERLPGKRMKAESENHHLPNNGDFLAFETGFLGKESIYYRKTGCLSEGFGHCTTHTVQKT